jgi:superfamily II DNA or RNA helicase
MNLAGLWETIMSFTDLSIKIKYRSLIDNLVDVFYTPVLEHSVFYHRAVGYFSSTILLEYVQGLRRFISNNGEMKLIISPYVVGTDYEALSDNTNVTQRVVEEMFNRFFNEQKTITASQLLVLLIKKGYLQIKIAEPKNKAGLFHEKIGLFYDSDNHVIAISGSNNETGQALSTNHESFNSFCSWVSGQERYVDQHKRDFDAYWNNEAPHLNVIDLEEAISTDFLKRFEGDQSIDELFDALIEEEKVDYGLNFTLYDFQEKGVELWFNSMQGILKYATGAGKTKTAIYLMNEIRSTFDKLFFVIVVPDKTLVNQWYDEIHSYGWETIRCFSGNPRWNVELKDLFDIFSVTSNAFYSIIVTNDTFFGGKFQRELEKLNDHYLLVVDECHTWGTERRLGKLPSTPYRLGLSATPELFFSESKTERLINFFGGIVHEYSLEQAIRDRRLVGYKYYPIFVGLNKEEKEQYDELTRKIVQLIGKDIAEYSDTYDKALEMLLFKRARVVYGAKSKLEYIEKHIDELKGNGNLLIYCGPTTYLNENKDELMGDSYNQLQAVNQILSRKGMRFAQYTSKESEQDRKSALNQFMNNSYSTLVAIKCLDEGINIPQVERALILASSTNPREFIQRRGRILRRSPGKEYSIIYDFVVYEPEYPALVQKEVERLYEFARIALNRDILFEEYRTLLNNNIKEGIDNG